MRRARADGRRVAVLAIDPTSPYTGGALLGDRVRMQEHATDPDVFIRSMATRGHLGGMSLAAPEAVRILDAAGFDLVIVETVGVGQAEIDVAAATDTTIVVLAPGLGDAIQMAKAGILEVADLFVVNKADRDGAGDVMRELRQMLHLGAARPWDPPVLATTAADGTGIDELWDEIDRHRAWLGTSGTLATDRETAVIHEVRALAAERSAEAVQAQLAADDALRARLRDRELDPYAAAEELIRRIGAGSLDPEVRMVGTDGRVHTTRSGVPVGRGLRSGPAYARRAARRVPVHPRPVRLDVSRAPVDDAPVRRVRHARRDERAVPIVARARADGVVGRVRHADADGP